MRHYLKKLEGDWGGEQEKERREGEKSKDLVYFLEFVSKSWETYRVAPGLSSCPKDIVLCPEELPSLQARL